MTPQAELGILYLFAIAAFVAFLAKRFDFPYAIGLVIVGLGIGNLTDLNLPHLSKELLFLVVLPGLLFEAAFQLKTSEVKEVKWTIAALAVPGVIISVGLTGLLVWGGLEALTPGGMSLMAAFLFASLICATDPVSVLSVLRSLGVNKTLAVTMEGESLFNDGTAVVLFTIILAMVGGATVTLASGSLDFLRITLGAAVVGVGVGMVVSLATRAVDDPLIEITLTLLCAYGAFVIAEMGHLSGVIACVVAGMIAGNWGARVGMSAPTRVAVESFWTYAAFALNSLIFLLVGNEINLATLIGYLPHIGLAWLAVLIVRAGVIYGKDALQRLMGLPHAPWSWSTVMIWGGLRGGLSMVLALAIPRDFEFRDLILNLTFGTVLLSLVFQGLTIKPLIAKLGLSSRSSAEDLDYERALGALRAAEAAAAEAERQFSQGRISKGSYTSAVQALKTRTDALRARIEELSDRHPALEASRQLANARHLLLIEKDSLRDSLRLGLISQAAFDALSNELDDQLHHYHLHHHG
ncbi:MAG: sodium:proton antiporter [Caulobacter sp.]|nr:sodium:proton antiporter [Caulobacter sp.]